MLHPTMFQDSRFRCILCEEKYFDKCWQVKKHLEEQHSGYTYKCSRCATMKVRRMKHVDCPATPQEMYLFHRVSGVKGAEAENGLKLFKEERMPSLWEETLRTLLPTPISPLPPSPPRLAPPLDKVYRNKLSKKYQKERSEKTATPLPAKRRRCIEEDLDLQHDPVEISLDQPDEVFHTSPDPRLEGVYFEPPQRLSDSEEDSHLDNSSEKKHTSERTISNSNSKNKRARTHTKSDKIKDNATKKNKVKSTTDRNSNSTDKGERTDQLSAKDTTPQTNETCARPELNLDTVLSDRDTAESAMDTTSHSTNHDSNKEQSAQVNVLRGKDTTDTSIMDVQEPPSDQGDVMAADTNPGSSVLPGNCLPINLGEEEIRPVITSLTRFNHKGATPYLRTVGHNEKLDELSRQLLLHFQRVQEQRVVLCIGGKRFYTSKVTLRADPNSFFSKMLREDSPMRPYNSNEYFIDRNPAHFNLILDYLRDGAHMDIALLPSEREYLMELLKEARFYMLGRLQEIVQERLSQVTRSEEGY